jgi:hypothetical protein
VRNLFKTFLYHEDILSVEHRKDMIYTWIDVLLAPSMLESLIYLTSVPISSIFLDMPWSSLSLSESSI